MFGFSATLKNHPRLNGISKNPYLQANRYTVYLLTPSRHNTSVTYKKYFLAYKLYAAAIFFASILVLLRQYEFYRCPKISICKPETTINRSWI